MTTLEELGLWYDEDTRCLVDTSSVSISSDISARVYQQNDSGVWMRYTGYALQHSKRTEDITLDNYLRTCTPKPQPGEVWELTLPEGDKIRAVPYPPNDGSVEFFTARGIFLLEDRILRRLLITAEGEYVG